MSKLDPAALRAAVATAFEPQQLPWLRRLVEQPSHTHEACDVEAAAALVDELAAELSLHRTLHPDPEGRFADHRVYRTHAVGSNDRCLALIGHVDTVFPRRLGFLAFQRDGDVLRGPGVLDMKSGLSSALFALRAIRAISPAAYRALPLRFVCVSDEEVGSPSNRALYRSLAPLTSAALVLESGREGDRVVTARKGAAVYRVEAQGRAAHAGNDHPEGVNAIHALALRVPAMEAITDYERGVTVNVGLFEGGTAKNTVPDRAGCTLDVRFERAADRAMVQQRLEAIVDRPLPGRLAAARLTLEGGVARPPMEPTPASQALRERYERHAAAAGLGIGEAPLQGGGSDANLLAAHGVPCIDGLGPYGQHFHRVEEWASAASLLRRTQALATFLAAGSG